MKKIIITSIVFCCAFGMLTACNLKNTRSSSPEPTTQGESTIKKDKEESTSNSEQLPIDKEVLDSYREGKGAIYYDINNMICVNMTSDTEGYHLAMNNGTEYDRENANWYVSFKNFGEEKTSVLIQEDGSQIESDIITIRGCLECLCLDALSADGFKTTEYRLYPIDNYEQETSPNEKLSEFSGTLENYDYKNEFNEATMADFFNDEQKELFANAEYLVQNSYIAIMFNTLSEEEYKLKDDRTYLSTGMSYESFVNYFESVFVPKLSSSIQTESEMYINIRGELCISEAACGTDMAYKSRTFKLVSQSKDELKFKLIAHYSYKDIMTEEDYNELSKDEQEFNEEYSFTMKNTVDGWRFTEFNYWM